jgi:menaquinol-cytochrome c reductase iron-sulfur subunit
LRKRHPQDLASSRRSFLAWVIGGLGTLSAALVGVPVLGTLVAPAARGQPEGSWIEFGPVESIPLGVPRLLTATSPARDAWYEHTVRRAVWVVRSQGDALTVFSPRCTHLGCAYRWEEQTKQFACPCHGGTYAITGEVTGGPPPRRLRVLPSTIEHGILRVRFV